MVYKCRSNKRTTTQVLVGLGKLDINKAGGADGIPAIALKNSAPEL